MLPTASLVVALTANTTASRLTLPRNWNGRYLAMNASGGDVYMLSGDSSVSASAAAIDATSSSQQAYVLQSGKTEDFLVPNGNTIRYISYVTASGTARFTVALTNRQALS
jgi:hypothetical protein